MEDIRPVPDHAVSLWFDGDKLVFTCPASFGEPAVHLNLPIDRCGVETTEGGSPLPTQRGWFVLLSILRERYHTATADRTSRTIGKPASPIEYIIEQMLKAKVTVCSKRKAKDDLQLEDLDL